MSLQQLAGVIIIVSCEYDRNNGTGQQSDAKQLASGDATDSAEPVAFFASDVASFGTVVLSTNDFISMHNTE